MERYDFDRQIDRQGTDCLKYDFAAERGRPADVLPFWVADMDFQAPEPVLDALREAVDHGIFGYSETKEDYTQTVAAWFRERFNWETRPEWLIKTPGVVFALAMAVRALTRAGDSVLIQPPVYYPFFSVIRDNNRVVVENRLCYSQGRYTIDFENFERQIVENQVKLFLLCSPHNPVGRVWTLDELRQMGHICARHGVYVVSDEIHCDFAFPKHPHHIFPYAVPELEGQSIVCTAPSKTFNLAGLQVSNIWIPSEIIRRRFIREIERCGYSQLNRLGLVAAKAAYTSGDKWLEQCQIYLRENLDFLRAFLVEHIPQIRLVEPEGTYFAWLDCSGLELSNKELDNLILHRAGLWLDSGAMFGGGAEQFQRVVLACPRKNLDTALERLAGAIGAR